MPWPDNRFSAVACNCMDCITDAEAPVAEMHRVLRPGGRLVLAAGSVSGPEQAETWGWRGWTEPELAALLEQTGFVDVELSHDASAT
jgi:ubiquinone/menaquinone biosynthesis C-methylase UbiE